jgi:ketosteroid isomerase-like protein
MNDENTELHESLVAAHHARIRAVLDSDVNALSEVVGEDLIFVSAFGKIQTRPEVFAAFASGALKIERMDSSDIATRIYGDIGILIYMADTKTIDGEVIVEGMTRSTTVYARRDGGWQLISQHQSRIE